MALLYTCKCGYQANVIDKHLDRKVKCPSCRSINSVKKPPPANPAEDNKSKDINPAFYCPKCKLLKKVDSKYLGRYGNCPNCKTRAKIALVAVPKSKEKMSTAGIANLIPESLSLPLRKLKNICNLQISRSLVLVTVAVITVGFLSFNIYSRNTQTEEIIPERVSFTRSKPSANIDKNLLSRLNIVKENLKTKRDLSGADLSNLDLSGLDFHGVSLKNANLVGANLSYANLSKADLAGAKLIDVNFFGGYALQANFQKSDLSGANCTKASFKNADLGKADLVKTILIEADLSGVKGRLANFKSAILFNANLREADLSKSNFALSNLISSNLAEVNLKSANFIEADLTNAVMKGADISKANFSKGILHGSDLSGANLVSATFSKADLSSAILNKANLTGAVFLHADLTGVEMSGVRSKLTDFRMANLTGANLSNADLTGAIFDKANLTQARLEKALLANASFESANLTGTDLRYANLTPGAILNGANLTKSDFANANLQQIDCRNANFTGANLAGARLNKTNFSQANFSGANLALAEITSADFSNTNMNYANLSEVNNKVSLKFDQLSSAFAPGGKMIKFNFRKANLRNANLKKANLAYSDLTGADLTGADVSMTNFADSDFRWSNLTGVRFFGANLRKADLSEADIQGADFKGSLLNDARIDAIKNLDEAMNLTVEQLAHIIIKPELKKNPPLGILENNEVMMVERDLPEKKDIKIWGLQVEAAGLLKEPYVKKVSLTKAFAGLSVLEANLLKYRLFGDGKNGVPGSPGITAGALFNVNYVPGNLKLPILVKWISPNDTVVYSSTIEVTYEELQVTTYTFPAQQDPVLGEWRIEFVYMGEVIGKHRLILKDPKAYNNKLRLL